LTAALYARTSTSDGKQSLETQLRELRLYVAKMGWDQYHFEFTDQVSGASTDRPGLEALMDMAAQHKFDIVVVFDLSRLTRRGPASAFNMIERLRSSGVELWSLKEEYFRTTGPAGPLLIAIAAYIAEQERLLHLARVNAGLARARAQGKTLGAPRRVVDREQIEQMRRDGFSLRQISQLLEVSKNTIDRRLKSGKKENRANGTRKGSARSTAARHTSDRRTNRGNAAS
jgi:DNA invertase Pin-like site-specific DNA recombinase